MLINQIKYFIPPPKIWSLGIKKTDYKAKGIKQKKKGAKEGEGKAN